jgi:hypothetical protein
MKCRMDKIESQVLPVPPNMIAALRTGFDAVANKIVVILIPITLDILLWLGPHLQIKTILNRLIDAVTSSTIKTVETGDLLSTMTDTLHNAAAQYNLLSLIRTYPVGVPSIMSSRQPTSIPLGLPVVVDITHPLVIIGIVAGLLLMGLVVGSFYYLLIAQVSLLGRIDLKQAISNWSWTALQVISLALALLLLFIIISIPSICIISAIALFGIPIGQFAFFIYIGIILWLAFPLIFSAHGIYVNHLGALASVQRSMVMTRMTLPTTALFILSIFVISEGLDILWRVPAEKSWLTLLGVGGHAFVTSALLAASFIYYRDADLWTQGTLKMLKSQVGLPLRGG